MSIPRPRVRHAWSLLALLSSLSPLAIARADDPSGVVPAAEPANAATGDEVGEEPADAEEQPMQLPWQLGPAKVALGHELELALPDGYQFLGQPRAGEVMEKMGNLYNDNLLGLVTSTREGDEYFLTLRYDEDGYIKDDEELDGDDLLESIREGEEEYNEERKKAGFSPIHAEGWQEAPHYDQAKHHVVWGLTVSDEQGSSVNYNTRVLGRKGYVSINLVTDTAALAHDKPAAATILAATSFLPGGRYEDFDDKTDKVAEYGLTGLVLGGAGFGLLKLAKIGLLAKFSKVIIAALIAGKKAIFALVLGGAALARKLFGKKSEGTEA